MFIPKPEGKQDNVGFTLYPLLFRKLNTDKLSVKFIALKIPVNFSLSNFFG